MRKLLRPRWLLRAGLLAAALVALVAGGSVAAVRLTAAGHLYAAESVPAAPVAIVFGAEIYSDGHPSPYVVGRLRVAQRLYQLHKVKAVLVTGDHGRWTYDEPDVMRDWLIAHGMPAAKVVADYAGFDTYQSCARARRVFGVRHAVLVSQDFHLPRAVALCRSVGIRADGVGDHQAHDTMYWRNWSRDQLADTKAAFDMVVQPDPTYLGHHESGVDNATRG
jgi:vancomycin permeability regulator SanA